MFRVILCIQFYRLIQLIFSTSLKGIIRKECQSFTNHGHAKTPPAVFNPLSLWLTLPRDMGVSHTQWPHSITRAILACLWFAQGSKKSKQQSHSCVPVGCTGVAQSGNYWSLLPPWSRPSPEPCWNRSPRHYDHPARTSRTSGRSLRRKPQGRRPSRP